MQSCLHRTVDQARQQGQGVRIRLRLSETPELADLPWEFLYDAGQSHFLAYSTTTPLVRYLDLAQTVPALAVPPPLNILVMIANPRDHGYANLDVEAEWRKVHSALANLQQRGLVQVTRLEAATLSALQRQLRRDDYHIFHFVGHGGFDRQTQSGVLLLEDEQGRSRRVSGHYLGALLRDHFSLRLALLNACEGARTSRFDPFAGVAQHLVQQGIPAVIAMQFEITDQAAITLAHEFYSALADNYGVDAALTEARKALYTAGNDIEWGTPVLYMRVQRGELFDLADFAATQMAPPTAQSALSREASAPTPSAEQLLQPTPETAVKDDTTQAEKVPASSTAATLEPSPATRQEQTKRPEPIVHDEARTANDANRIFRDEKPKADPLIPSTPKGRQWWKVGLGLVGVIVVVPLSIFAIQSYQDNRLRTQATSRVQQAQATTTALAVDVRTQMVTQAPALQPLAERFNMLFVEVPAGEFQMGSPEGVGDSDEHPQHTVALDTFWINQTEVTNAQYRPFIEAGGYQQDQWWTDAGRQWRDENKITQPYYWNAADWNGDNYPVVDVSWYEAVAYAQWLSNEFTLTVRLPTEAEWERAARGDDGRIYPWGNEWDGAKANYCAKECYSGSGGYDGYTSTAPVGSYTTGASRYGVLDMAGNVREWTATWWLNNYENYANLVNNSAEGNADTRRVVRGSSWGSDPYYARGQPPRGQPRQ
ncbi:MAG: SUMF1/EgtB/PvdO family nonheme iron enzyme [Caldilineaceae bacterium]